MAVVPKGRETEAKGKGGAWGSPPLTPYGVSCGSEGLSGVAQGRGPPLQGAEAVPSPVQGHSK